MTPSRLRSRGWMDSARSIAPLRLQPEMVGSAAHQRLAAGSRRSRSPWSATMTSVIPIRLDPGQRILSLEPEPVNITPADTTTFYPQMLATALRTRHPHVTEVIYPHHPGPNDISGAVEATKDHDLVVIGTVTAPAGQTRLVDALRFHRQTGGDGRPAHPIRPRFLPGLDNSCLHLRRAHSVARGAGIGLLAPSHSGGICPPLFPVCTREATGSRHER